MSDQDWNDQDGDEDYTSGWFRSVLRNLWRSGMVTALAIGLLVIGLLVAYRERGRGHLHRLELKIVAEHKDAPVFRPGGQEAVVLTRSRMPGGSVPEFLSATMLPGRGMNVLQITAYVPGVGEVELLRSTTVEEAERLMAGGDGDINGRASLAFGGALEAPWAGGIWGPSAQGSDRIATTWRGHTMTLAATGPPGVPPVAWGGAMLRTPSTETSTAGMPDGGQTQATFAAEDFGVHWPSKTEVTATVLLGSRWIELTMTAKNTGDTAVPVGLGWHPRFAVEPARREQTKLRVEAQMRVDMRDRQSGLPSGTIVPVAGTPYDFSQRGGTTLGRLDVNDTFVHLHQDLLDNGPLAELSEPAQRYGLRVTALSPTIKAMHVTAPANGDFVSIDPQFNFDDPFGREWAGADTGMVVLQPGQTTQWKVRLELFSTIGSTSPI